MFFVVGCMPNVDMKMPTAEEAEFIVAIYCYGGRPILPNTSLHPV
jgi:hypothetical protein